ncbi:non-hydrolyzing UDP-N-acetylglucosamine 2-epimerase [Enterovibrio norvegicus]|uniref:non-hydrolyzing UDP-N-acetylglucosamine 2-epimerase n=1 Tax=Enterovibrio norvegicus TaxID=188144 RepID=UPI003899E59B
MKIVTILGARPQFIKAGSVSREIARFDQQGIKIEEVIVHTGQHYDSNMSDVFFAEMHIPKPNYNLGIGGQSHGKMTGEMIAKIEDVLIAEKPDYVMVYGDTNSTLAGAVAASKLGIKIAHVEAGLRSFNLHMPEELNRVMTDRVSHFLFCPTSQAIKNLENEGVHHWTPGKMILTGDVMYDGAMYYRKLATPPSDFPHSKGYYCLATIHRAENTDCDKKLRGVFEALERLSDAVPVVLPLHPRTRAKLQEIGFQSKNITLIDPVGYLNMIWLIENAKFVVTDSGGLQKEAYFFDKRCIVVRDETEWSELVDLGFNKLVEPNYNSIFAAYEQLSTEVKGSDGQLYGDGSASRMIVEAMLNG